MTLLIVPLNKLGNSKPAFIIPLHLLLWGKAVEGVCGKKSSYRTIFQLFQIITTKPSIPNGGNDQNPNFIMLLCIPLLLIRFWRSKTATICFIVPII